MSAFPSVDWMRVRDSLHVVSLRNGRVLTALHLAGLLEGHGPASRLTVLGESVRFAGDRGRTLNLAERRLMSDGLRRCPSWSCMDSWLGSFLSGAAVYESACGVETLAGCDK